MTEGEKDATATASDERAPEATAPEPPKASAEAAEAPATEAAPEPAPEPVVDPELQSARAELEAARRDLEAAQARLRMVSKAYTDLQAEMKSFRERMEARAKLDSELQSFDQVKTFFDPVMNLRRSVGAPGEDVGVLVEGLKMVLAQFMDSLRRLGLEEVPGEGAPFDPNMHEALAVTPVTDAALDGKVLMVHTGGFTVKGRVLQAAQVVIGKLQEPAGDA